MLFREHYYNRMSTRDHTPNARYLHEATVTLKNVLLGNLQAATPSLDIPRCLVLDVKSLPSSMGSQCLLGRLWNVGKWDQARGSGSWKALRFIVHFCFLSRLCFLFLGVPLACSLPLCIPFLNGQNPLRLLTKINLSSPKWLLSGIW